MSKRHSVFIDETGNIVGVASPLTQILKLGDRRRVSHVEPVNPLLRKVYHFIRNRVDDESRMASITRRWPCVWQARIFDGPVLGPFRSRRKAIEAEVRWIEHKLRGNR